MDALTMILLGGGLILLLAGIFKFSRSHATALSIIGVIALIIGGLSYAGAVNFGRYNTFQSVPQQPAAFSAVPLSSECSPNAITSNGLSRADLLYRNIENSSGLGYLAASVSANNNGLLVDSATTNAGATASYVSMSNIPNCGSGQIMALTSSGPGVASSKYVYDLETGQLISGYSFIDKAAHKYEVRGASADVLSCDMSNFANAISSSWQANGSTGSEVVQTSGHTFVSGAGTSDGNVYFTNTSLGVKGTINFYIHCQVNNTATAYGAYNEADAVVFSYTIPVSGASKFSASSLTLASNTPGWSLNKQGCPEGVTNNRNAKACWTAPTMKAGTLYEMKGTITADTADPVVGDNPSINIDNKVYYRDTDGVVKYGTYNSAGTHQGVGATILNFVVN